MVSIWFPLIYNAHHVSHLLSFHFTFLLPCRTQHSGGRSPWAVFRPRAISDHGCRRGGGSIDGYLQIDWYIWYMTYVYIYICTVYTVIWEYGNYTGPNSIFAERERKKEWEPCCQRLRYVYTSICDMMAICSACLYFFVETNVCSFQQLLVMSVAQKAEELARIAQSSGACPWNGSGSVVRPESGALLIFSPRNSHHHIR